MASADTGFGSSTRLWLLQSHPVSRSGRCRGSWWWTVDVLGGKDLEKKSSLNLAMELMHWSQTVAGQSVPLRVVLHRQATEHLYQC